jgi:hypothetical protein
MGERLARSISTNTANIIIVFYFVVFIWCPTDPKQDIMYSDPLVLFDFQDKTTFVKNMIY